MTISNLAPSGSPNVSRTFEMTEGTYDIRFDDCRQHVIFQRFDVPVHDGDVLEFHQSEIQPHR